METGQPVIRNAEVADCPAIARIYAENVDAFDATMDLTPRPPEHFAGLVSTLGARERFVVLEQNKELLGWGRIMAYSDRAGYAPAAETAVYLRRDHRREGLGSLLKKWIIGECRRLGYHHLVARVFAHNRASIEYNRRFGYELVGIQREIGWVNRRWEDVAILQLVLGDVPPPGTG